MGLKGYLESPGARDSDNGRKTRDRDPAVEALSVSTPDRAAAGSPGGRGLRCGAGPEAGDGRRVEVHL